MVPNTAGSVSVAASGPADNNRAWNHQSQVSGRVEQAEVRVHLDAGVGTKGMVKVMVRQSFQSVVYKGEKKKKKRTAAEGDRGRIFH